MLVRSWSARATPAGTESYRRHFEDVLLPRLEAVPGQRGALLLCGNGGPERELVVLTFWDSMDAIRSFAGSEPTTAVVTPEARAALVYYDREVRIFEVLRDIRH